MHINRVHAKSYMTLMFPYPIIPLPLLLHKEQPSSCYLHNTSILQVNLQNIIPPFCSSHLISLSSSNSVMRKITLDKILYIEVVFYIWMDLEEQNIFKDRKNA